MVTHTGKSKTDAMKRQIESGERDEKNLYCSFCGKSQHEVRKLIAGPTVFICDECVDLCSDIIRQDFHIGGLLKEHRYPEIFGVEIPKQFHEGVNAPNIKTVIIAKNEGKTSPVLAQKAVGKTLLQSCKNCIIDVVDCDIVAARSALDSATAALAGYDQNLNIIELTLLIQSLKEKIESNLDKSDTEGGHGHSQHSGEDTTITNLYLRYGTHLAILEKQQQATAKLDYLTTYREMVERLPDLEATKDASD